MRWKKGEEEERDGKEEKKRKGMERFCAKGKEKGRMRCGRKEERMEERMKERENRRKERKMMSLKVIHFQSIFLIYFYLKKTDLCAEIWNN